MNGEIRVTVRLKGELARRIEELKVQGLGPSTVIRNALYLYFTLLDKGLIDASLEGLLNTRERCSVMSESVVPALSGKMQWSLKLERAEEAVGAPARGESTLKEALKELEEW